MNIVTKSKGFTIVEMIVVVVVLGILVGLSTFGYRNWQQGLAQRAVQSDLRMASAAMENEKNFKEGYPNALPSGYESSQDVTLTYVGGNATTFCLQGGSTKYPSILYYVDSSAGKEPKVGSCSSAFAIGTPYPTFSNITVSSMTISWAPVSGATNYMVRYGTTSPNTTAACTASPCNLTGLTASTDYQITLTASSQYASKTSITYTTRTSTPAIPAPSAPAATYAKTKSSSTSYSYNVTATGGTCSMGTTEWKIVSTSNGDDPNFGTASWQSTNTKSFSQVINGYVEPSPLEFYVKPRCVSGTNATEYPSYAFATN